MKRTLGYDIARCAGRYGFDTDGDWCLERDTCQRYLAFIKWDKATGVPDHTLIPVSMAVESC